MSEKTSIIYAGNREGTRHPKLKVLTYGRGYLVKKEDAAKYIATGKFVTESDFKKISIPPPGVDPSAAKKQKSPRRGK